jgi:hypothetical protein
VQIQDYHGERNPYYHTAQDDIYHINPDYLFEQVKATVAFAGQLSYPIIPSHRLRLPLVNYR